MAIRCEQFAELGLCGGRHVSNAFLLAGVTAVAWCSPLPTSRPRKTSMSPVSIGCRHLHHAVVRHYLGIELPHPRYGELFQPWVKPVLKPIKQSVDASGPGDTIPRIMNNKGGKSCRTRRPEDAPLRSHENGNGGSAATAAIALGGQLSATSYPQDVGASRRQSNLTPGWRGRIAPIWSFTGST